MNLIKVTVKQTLSSKIIFKSVILLGGLRLISLNLALKLVNNSIKKGAFRYKIGEGDWKNLNNFEITLEKGV